MTEEEFRTGLPPQRHGTEVLNLPEPKDGMRIVGMCIYKDRLIVATERGVYERVGDTFFRLKFEEQKNG